MPVNWCPALKAVLANEEVVDGKSEIGGHPVEKKLLRQWVLKITEYADRLIEDLDTLDWPEGIKEMQRNWIGKSEGCEFEMKKSDDPSKSIRVYTTRIDTVYGMTYAVLAPDHPSVGDFITDDYRTICERYIAEAKGKSDQDRTNE
jgi:leucyl-tRNA synthetase